VTSEASDASGTSGTDATVPLAYVADNPRVATPSSDELRRRIPGWGVDLDPADRPSVPRLDRNLPATGAHWTFPERQEGGQDRERSIEHAFLTPVFGTAQPLKGLSGGIRRFGYRYSEGRLAHWMLLVLGDRVDVAESRVTAILRGKPDNPIAETGIGAERGDHPLASRLKSTRSDTHHTWIDPVIVSAPWLVGAAVVWRLIRRARR
jgi:hypothetical protein